MKKVISKSFPFEGYGAITLFYWIFIREEYAKHFNAVDENHETIHFWQLVGLFAGAAILVLAGALLSLWSAWWLLLTPFTFYIVYGAWWLCTTPPSWYWDMVKWYLNDREGDSPENEAYYNLPFEREAYTNEADMTYNVGFWHKPLFTWVKHIRRA